MIRKLIQTVLCLLLSTVLVAQQIPAPVVASNAPQKSAPGATANAPHQMPEFVTIPKDTKIGIVALENVSSETATSGSFLRFAVAKDVVINGITVIHAGAPVTGTITKVKRGVANHQWAELRIHMEDVRIGHSLRLRLSPWEPAARQSDPGLVATCIALPVLCLALKHLQDDGWGEDGPPKPNARSGVQAVLPLCVSFGFWVTSAKSIPETELRMNNAGSTTQLNVACPRVLEESQVYETPEIERLLFR